MVKSSADWTDIRRKEYLRSVLRRLDALKLLVHALEVGTLADPYTIPDELRRIDAEINAVLNSYEA